VISRILLSDCIGVPGSAMPARMGKAPHLYVPPV
jgi:hypothetical protein